MIERFGIMKEYLLYIVNDPNDEKKFFNIDEELKRAGAFPQSSMRGAINYNKIAKEKRFHRGDLIHVVTSMDKKIKYTLTVANLLFDEDDVILSWFDEYKNGIPISGVKELFKLSKQMNFDRVDGLYHRIYLRGTRNCKLLVFAPTKREKELLYGDSI